MAAANPEKVKELKEFSGKRPPRTTSAAVGRVLVLLRPAPPDDHATHYVYRAGMENLPPGEVPHMDARSYTITAGLTVPDAGAEGVLIANGSFLGGFALYVEDGKLKHTYNFYGLKADTLTSPEKLPTARSTPVSNSSPTNQGSGHGRQDLLVRE